MKALRRATRALAAGFAQAILFALSARAWLVLCGVGGAVLIVQGVAQVAGAGWALITAGTFLLATAVLIRRGMSNA